MCLIDIRKRCSERLNKVIFNKNLQRFDAYTSSQGNVIAALNTGSGKTLISLLLIKWITSQELSRGKVVIFLVPKVTLVVQQWEYLKNRTPLRIGKLHGAVEASRSLSDRVGWKKLFNNHDVFVMTGTALFNFDCCLYHSNATN